ncbi:hypothetical protein FIU95_08005 [Microbulbifer sp. THAF38]|nr:hypothetical protein FIU95_08005 [Microbulbifer sp. THAF38]
MAGMREYVEKAETNILFLGSHPKLLKEVG